MLFYELARTMQLHELILCHIIKQKGSTVTTCYWSRELGFLPYFNNLHKLQAFSSSLLKQKRPIRTTNRVFIFGVLEVRLYIRNCVSMIINEQLNVNLKFALSLILAWFSRELNDMRKNLFKICKICTNTLFCVKLSEVSEKESNVFLSQCRGSEQRKMYHW